MSELAYAHPQGSEPWRPNLAPLIALLILGCSIAAFFLVHTYGIRKASIQYMPDGRAYVLRVSEPLDMPPEIKAGGARFIQSIAQVQQQAETLRADIAGRAADDQAYETELTAFLTQLETAEATIASLKREIASMREARRASTASAVTRTTSD